MYFFGQGIKKQSCLAEGGAEVTEKGKYIQTGRKRPPRMAFSY